MEALKRSNKVYIIWDNSNLKHYLHNGGDTTIESVDNANIIADNLSLMAETIRYAITATGAASLTQKPRLTLPLKWNVFRPE